VPIEASCDGHALAGIVEATEKLTGCGKRWRIGEDKMRPLPLNGCDGFC
jgi:hypothetical protein